MRICFVSGQSVSGFLEKQRQEQADLYIFGFKGIGEVSYEKELQGRSKFFEEAAILSKKTKSVVVSGCITDTRGQKRKSAVVAENGQLKGVSDMLHVVDEELSAGATLRVYETKIGRIGVAVAEDLHFPEVIKALVDCSSDFIVCPYMRVENELPALLVRANAYFFGTPVFFCSEGYAMLSNTAGELVFASPQETISIDFENTTEYHIVQTRKKGIYKGKT